ncbi:unnamed protein product [Adineta ricciae]|uniref:Nuclear receptor domain-containing protein n=1 Tax=Adineta ricciae TaxID=249248 RepID=A0A814BFB4_ADIRI|nr:unnamed protein product [Adineta ricciae]CAF1426134.1 unnamed protein product [Adineta ricciae]
MISRCKICEAPAQGVYYGCIACKSCKTFFKRNAEKQRLRRCLYGNNCHINISNGHICTCCRLKKCLENGMDTTRFRESWKNSKQNKLMAQNSNIITLKTPEKLATLNLLTADQSGLTSDQWKLLSNLLQCYDEYSGLLIGRNYMYEQNKFPVKLRYKPVTVIELITSLMRQNPLLYINNRDFIDLSENDRALLLDNTLVYTTTSSVNFIHSQIGLNDLPVFLEAVGLISHPSYIPTVQQVAHRIVPDSVIMKLLLAIISFSTVQYTVYRDEPPRNLSNIGRILKIQDEYVDLAWRYLVYTYKFEWTVKYFSDLLRFLFVIHDGVRKSEEVKWYTNTIDSLTQQTKDVLTVKD